MIKQFTFALDDGRGATASLDEIQRRIEAWGLPEGVPKLDGAENQIPDQLNQSRIVFFPPDATGIRRRAGVIALTALIPEPHYTVKFDDGTGAEGSADQVEQKIVAQSAGYHLILPAGGPSKRVGPLKLGESAKIVVGVGTSPADYKETSIGTVTFAEER